MQIPHFIQNRLLAGAAACLLAGCTAAPPPEGRSKQVWTKTMGTEKPERSVFVHVMVFFRSKAYSGQWNGWNYSNAQVQHDPDVVGPGGRRDIASVYYPRLGAYDMTDPYTAEAHCQMLKLAGVDGFLFDVASFGTPEPGWAVEAVRRYVDCMQRYGLRGGAIYEDKTHWLSNPLTKTREEAVRAARADMDAWLELLAPVQYRVEGRPLFGLFSYEQDVPGKGISRLSPDELRDWLDTFSPEERPLVVSSWFKEEYRGVLDGPYDWIWLEGPPPTDGVFRNVMSMADMRHAQARREAQREDWVRRGVARFRLGGVWPGFDSRGCWGWDGEPAFAPREGGEVYRYQWDRVLETEVPAVQVVTWNDWFEGTPIEPSVEEGYFFLELTRDYAARYKGVTPPDGDLGLAERIYALRKSDIPDETRDQLDQACDLIRQSRFADASGVLKAVGGTGHRDPMRNRD